MEQNGHKERLSVCSSLREHLGVKSVMFGVYKDWVCKKNVMGWHPCFRIVSASQCTLEWAPHTYPTSENSSTLPCSACWGLRRHYRFACFVLKSLLWYFFPVTREEIYKCGPYCNWFTVSPLLNFPFPGGALLFFFFCSVHCPSLNITVAEYPNEQPCRCTFFGNIYVFLFQCNGQNKQVTMVALKDLH